MGGPVAGLTQLMTGAADVAQHASSALARADWQLVQRARATQRVRATATGKSTQAPSVPRWEAQSAPPRHTHWLAQGGRQQPHGAPTIVPGVLGRVLRLLPVLHPVGPRNHHIGLLVNRAGV